MNPWLLDANVLILAQRAGRLSALLKAANRAPFVLVEEVYDELVRANTARSEMVRRARDMERALQKSSVRRVAIPLQSSASILYRALRAGRETQSDAGEAASIAWASANHDARFVTADRGASWIALREIGPRVWVLPCFLNDLVKVHALTPDDADKIVNKSGTPPPTWWPPPP